MIGAASRPFEGASYIGRCRKDAACACGQTIAEPGADDGDRRTLGMRGLKLVDCVGVIGLRAARRVVSIQRRHRRSRALPGKGDRIVGEFACGGQQVNSGQSRHGSHRGNTSQTQMRAMAHRFVDRAQHLPRIAAHPLRDGPRIDGVDVKMRGRRN